MEKKLIFFVKNGKFQKNCTFSQNCACAFCVNLFSKKIIYLFFRHFAKKFVKKCQISQLNYHKTPLIRNSAFTTAKKFTFFRKMAVSIYRLTQSTKIPFWSEKKIQKPQKNQKWAKMNFLAIYSWRTSSPILKIKKSKIIQFFSLF